MADVSTANANKEKVLYLIEAPGVLRSNSRYNVVVGIFEAPGPCTIAISLYGGEFKIEESIEIQPMSTKTLKFEIPELNTKEEYFLSAEGREGIEFNEKINLRFKEGKPIVYIQCDKQAYKRGDNVAYRVCFLERDLLRPATIEKPISAKIKLLDAVVSENIVTDLEKALYTGEWTIPEDAPHGTYDIEVFVDEVLVALKSFEVINYVTPKFDIKINTAKEVLYSDKQLNLNMEANYADGTPVTGSCKMEIRTVAGYFSGVDIEKSLPIEGGKTENTIIDLVDDLEIDNSFMEEEWFTTATVMVKVTIIAENTDEETLTTLLTVKKNDNSCDEEYGSCRRCSDWCDLETDESPEDDNPAIKILKSRQNVAAGEEFEFSIEITKPAKYCIYFIVARGNIVDSELFEVEDDTIPIKRTLNTQFIHVPRAFILAYIIYEGVLYYDEVGINLSNKFEYQLEITAPESSEPDATIPIQIKSAPSSLVALMAVDEKSIVLHAKNDLKPDHIFDDLHHIRSQTPMVKGSGNYPGLAPGLVVFTNAIIDSFSLIDKGDGWFCRFFDREHYRIESRMPRIDTEAKKKEITRAIQERNQVFGYWIFDAKETDENGDLCFDVTLPSDTVTTWILTAFSLNENEGFSMTKTPLNIKAMDATTPTQSPPKTEILKAQSQVTEFVVDHYENGASKNTLVVEQLDNTTPVEITFSITENLYGSTIAELPEFAGIMYCTGHLHMTTMIPNVNVLEYLDALNQLDSEFASSIKKRFPEAFVRELSERKDANGSFSWFGRDPSGSPHVTSLVLQTFQRAAKYVDVDPTIIERGLNYLASTQMESGEITPENEPYKYPFEKGVGVGLTAMVLPAFLLNEDVKEKYKELIDKAFSYIVANIEPIQCVFDLALAFYAMQLAKHPYADTLKERLFNIAKTNELKNHKWWSYTLEPQNADPESDAYLPISELQVTSYVLLGLLETESIETMLPIIKWMLPLTGVGNETMDCAVGLNAALKMAIKSGAPLAIMNLEYTAYSAEEERSGKITLTPENSSRIQIHVLPKTTERIEFSTDDKGTFFGKLTYRYVEK